MIKAKTKGVYLCVTEQTVFGARTSSSKAPFEVEEVFSLPREERGKLSKQISGFVEAKQNNYVVSNVAISPRSRFMRVFDLDIAARKKNPNYYTDLLKSQFRIDHESHAVGIVEADTGAEADLDKGAITRLMFCGASNEDLVKEQNDLVELNVYPSSLEIASICSMGAILDYSNRFKIEGAILVLEMSAESSQAFIVREGKVDVTRPIPYGIHSMIPVVRQELGLKDEESAKKLFFSNTFDFTEVGPKLLRKLIRELQASTGFYEVQTGQTISRMFLPQLPSKLSWVRQVLVETLGVEALNIDAPEWLKSHEVEIGNDVDPGMIDDEWFGLLSLLCPFQAEISNGEEETEQSS
ncbi:MAG: hypothetical protein AAGB06_04770 [Verrucomicrobiota bacterium]